MGALKDGILNQRQELYAQNLAAGMSQQQASIRAGYSNNPSRASRQAHDPRIISRVAAIQAAAGRRVEKDKAWVIKELVEIEDLAKQVGDFGACNKSLELIGKELGMFREKVEVDVSLTRRLVMERLTDEDAEMLTNIVRKIEGRHE